VIYALLHERRLSIVLNDAVHPEFHRIAKVAKRQYWLTVELFQPSDQFVSFFLTSDGIVLHGSFTLNGAVFCRLAGISD
jgi:hypothetical protein